MKCNNQAFSNYWLDQYLSIGGPLRVSNPVSTLLRTKDKMHAVLPSIGN